MYLRFMLLSDLGIEISFESIQDLKAMHNLDVLKDVLKDVIKQCPKLLCGLKIISIDRMYTLYPYNTRRSEMLIGIRDNKFCGIETPNADIYEIIPEQNKSIIFRSVDGLYYDIKIEKEKINECGEHKEICSTHTGHN